MDFYAAALQACVTQSESGAEPFYRATAFQNTPVVEAMQYGALLEAVNACGHF